MRNWKHAPTHFMNIAVVVGLITFGMGGIAPVSGQTPPARVADAAALRSRLESRFQVLPLANGVLLTPRSRSSVRSIEVTDAIAIDGVTVTGSELREKLGLDADVVLQVSYLDAAGRRALAGAVLPAAPAAGQTPAAGQAPEMPAPSSAAPRPIRSERRGDVVRFGGSITVAEHERVEGDVVAIGGSADIDGEVDGDAVVIGGSLKVGPHADIRRDVTVIGGRLDKDPNAIVGGKVTEVGVGDAIRGSGDERRARGFGQWRRATTGFGLAATIVRIVLVMLLAGIVLLVASAPVRQVADRASAEPMKSWAVGFLIEVLFVPVLVLTIVVLVISIIGIPLLVLLPIAIVAALVLCLTGFTGVAFHLGRLIDARFEPLRGRPYLATTAGILLVVSPLLLARMLGAVPGLGLVALLVGVAGVVIEYVAWTTGLGALALTRLAPKAPPAPVLPAPVAPVSSEL